MDGLQFTIYNIITYQIEGSDVMKNIKSATEQRKIFCHNILNSNKTVSRATNHCKCYIYDLIDMNGVKFSYIV